MRGNLQYIVMISETIEKKRFFLGCSLVTIKHGYNAHLVTSLKQVCWRNLIETSNN